MTWKQLFHALVRPPEAGGMGMAPSEVKKLTLWEIHLYARDEKSIGGVQKMSHDDAMAFYPPEHNPKGKGKGKKYPDAEAEGERRAAEFFANISKES